MNIILNLIIMAFKQTVLEICCNTTGVPIDLVMSKNRMTEVVYVRQLICKIATDMGVPRSSIAEMLGISTEAVRQAKINAEIHIETNDDIYTSYYKKATTKVKEVLKNIKNNI